MAHITAGQRDQLHVSPGPPFVFFSRVPRGAPGTSNLALRVLSDTSLSSCCVWSGFVFPSVFFRPFPFALSSFLKTMRPAAPASCNCACARPPAQPVGPTRLCSLRYESAYSEVAQFTCVCETWWGCGERKAQFTVLPSPSGIVFQQAWGS